MYVNSRHLKYSFKNGELETYAFFQVGDPVENREHTFICFESSNTDVDLS